jgi:hypothetical protein
MQADMYDALMTGASISFGDHLHPVYGWENEVETRVKKVFDEHLLYEPYVKNSNPVAEVGVIISGDSGQVNDYAYGIDLMLKELKVPYKIYHTDGDFLDNKLLIIAEDLGADTQIKDKIKNFAKTGKIIFTGKGIDFANRANLVDYIKVVGDDLTDNAYFIFNGDMRWATYRQSKLIKNVCGKELSRYVSNICNFDYDGRQSYFYRPQGDITDYSVCVTDGNTGCICFDIFDAYKEMVLKEQRDLFSALLDELYKDRLVTTKNLPVSTEIAITKSNDYTVLHVKATYPIIKSGRGIIEEHNSINSGEVSVLGKFKVYTLPDNKKVKCCYKNGKTTFNTGDILGYKAFLLKN